MYDTTKAVFFVPPKVHILDLAGPIQAFYEAGEYGHPYDIIYCSTRSDVKSSSLLTIGNLTAFESIRMAENDLLFVPGFEIEEILSPAFEKESRPFRQWMLKAHQNGAHICSICSGAFVLAQAGLLDDKRCTTHWKRIDQLKKHYPRLRLIRNELYVQSERIYTSAGILSGVDLAIYLLEQRHGAKLAFEVAREMVAYIRRAPTDHPDSVYLRFRNHMDDDVHHIQNWIITHLHQKITIEQLAALAHTSPRNMTRRFKKSTGMTIHTYLTQLRLEKASRLLNDPNHTMEYIARACGYNSTNQLRNILRK